MKFVGVVDRKGVESFYSLEEARAKGLISFLVLRAQANAWRGTMIFCVELNSAEQKQIEKMLQGHKWVEVAKVVLSKQTCSIGK